MLYNKQVATLSIYREKLRQMIPRQSSKERAIVQRLRQFGWIRLARNWGRRRQRVADLATATCLEQRVVPFLLALDWGTTTPLTLTSEGKIDTENIAHTRVKKGSNGWLAGCAKTLFPQSTDIFRTSDLQKWFTAGCRAGQVIYFSNLLHNKRYILKWGYDSYL